jgi:hypothetical protein
MHVSDLLHYMGVRMGHLKESDPQDTIQGHKDALEAYQAGTDGHSPLLLKIALGLAWEDWYMPQAAAYPGSTFEYHPGELYLDGVSGSPDALEYVEDRFPGNRGLYVRPIVHECKLTWDHGSTSIESKWLWLSQIRSYCHMMAKTWRTGPGWDITAPYLPIEGCLHVFNVNGFMAAASRRAKAGQPYGTTYRLSFTPDELTRTWTSLMVAKRELERDQDRDQDRKGETEL